MANLSGKNKRKSSWGGRRPNTGRPKRSEKKTQSIWCGQMPAEAREFIIESLSAEERRDVLIAAACEIFPQKGMEIRKLVADCERKPHPLSQILDSI